MIVAMDAVVQEYLWKMIRDLCKNVPSFDECTQGDDAAKEEVIMAMLTGLVVGGLATHRFIRREKLDEFRATQRLIKHWSWLFAGSILQVEDTSEMSYISIERHRSHYFGVGWDKPDPDAPPGYWRN